MRPFLVTPWRNLPSIPSAYHLARPASEVVENGCEGLRGNFATLVDDDDLGQVVKPVSQGGGVPVPDRLGAVDAEVVVDRLGLHRLEP